MAFNAFPSVRSPHSTFLCTGKSWSPQRLTTTPWAEEDLDGNMQDREGAEAGSSCEPDDFFLRQATATSIGLSLHIQIFVA